MNKKRNLISSIFFLILLISVASQATIYVNNIKCSETGYLILTIEYGCRDVKCSQNPKKLFSSINITVVSTNKSYIVEFDNPPEWIYQKEYKLLSKSVLDPYNDYKIVTDDGEEKKEYSIKCPNIDFLCEKIDLEIDLCMKNKLDFYYLFHGLGNQFSSTELREELDYYINPANTYLGSVALISNALGRGPIKSEDIPDNFEVKQVGNDTYLLKVSAVNLKKRIMNSIYIDVKDCDKSKYSIAALKKCQEQECYSNEDCPIGSYCSKKRCKILLCQDCETIKDHSCVSDCKQTNFCEENICENDLCKQVRKKNCCLGDPWCNDSKVCTKDECVNNLCRYEEIRCEESADPCIIGLCEEPKGCRYVRNIECENKEEQSKIISEITGAIIGNTPVSQIETIILTILLLLLIIGLVLILILNKNHSNKKVKKSR